MFDPNGLGKAIKCGLALLVVLILLGLAGIGFLVWVLT